MDDIATEWGFCPDCGRAVHNHGNYLTEVNSDFSSTELEHECRELGS